jgi:sarcosine oxidase subunit alpha
LAVVKGGLDKIGEAVMIPLANGKQVNAKITSSVFYDSEGARQHVE